MTFKKVLLSAVLCAGAAVLTAADAAKMVAEDALTLHLGFDGTADADIAEGEGKAAEIRGTIKYAPGLVGQALLMDKGTGIPLYWVKDNLNFDQPGTLVFWFKANSKWHAGKAGSSIVFFGLGGAGGYIGLKVYGGGDVCYCKRPLAMALYHSTVRPDAEYHLQPPALTKLCRGWHLVAMAWAGDQAYLSYDGAPFRAYKMTKPLSNAEFAHCTRFAVGCDAAPVLIDEFCLYGKKLEDAELQQLWDSHPERN